MNNNELKAIYKKYSTELYVYALSLCKDHYLSQDLVSDTFFKALLSIDSYQNHIKYWLFKVCKNLYLDHLKKNKYLHGAEVNLDNLLIEESTLDKILFTEEKRRIYCEILKLQPSYKEIIILYYYCDFSLKEISLMVGMSQGAARTLLFRARRKIKDGLEEEFK